MFQLYMELNEATVVVYIYAELTGLGPKTVSMFQGPLKRAENYQGGNHFSGLRVARLLTQWLVIWGNIIREQGMSFKSSSLALEITPYLFGHVTFHLASGSIGPLYVIQLQKDKEKK